MVTLYERLTDAIDAKVMQTYINESILSIFGGVDIPGGIGMEKFIHKHMTDIPEAALSSAGFRPSSATFDASEFGDYIFTAAEQAKIDERQWAFFEQHGLATSGIEMLGKKVANLASYYLWRGVDKEGAQPYTQYNYINATGSGTLAAPSIITTATAGGWVTAEANKHTDLAILLGQLEAKNFNIGSTIVFYPKAASSAMRKVGSNTRDGSPIEMLLDQGVFDVIALPNEYMYTAAGADPASTLFDLYAIDMSKVGIGYTRWPRTLVTDLRTIDRTVTVDAEVWFAPFFEAINDGTTQYKGVSRITAIQPFA